jgi:tripartite-type tricarboxylate transporter receptor subunit TctC
MRSFWRRWAATATVCAIVCAIPAHAQDYPSRPVVVVTSTPPGNGPDVIARIVADGLSHLWKQNVVIENRPGGRAVIATSTVKRAAPDGYTLYVALGSTFVILPEIQHDLPFDLDRDLAPVAMVGVQPFVIAVNPKLGVHTLAELIELSKKRPDEILYGTPRGSAPHLAVELLQAKSGSKLKLIPYQATNRAVNDALSGTISVVVESLPALSSAIAAGRLKALAVTSLKRLPEYPDVPTVAEVIPGFDAGGWFVLMAPAGTPEAIRSKINADLRTVLERPDVRDKYARLGTYAVVRSPEQVAQFIRDQHRVWAPVVHHIGLTN